MRVVPQAAAQLFVILGLASIGCGSNPAASNSILILGDSYVAANGGLHTILKALFEHAGDKRVIEGLVSGGKDLAWHLQQVESSGSPHEAALGSRGRQWGFVVLQDRSHVPAYCCNGNATEFFSEYSASLAAVQKIDDIAKEKGARTVFFQTWGRRGGAPVPFLQDFELMNEQVVRGYELYAAQLIKKGREPIIAPVGEAFKSLYDDVVSASNLKFAMTAPNGWRDLFAKDGSHPSLAGSYFAACTLYAAITNKTPIGLVGLPGLDDTHKKVLQMKAHETVFLKSSLPRSLKEIEGRYDSKDPAVSGPVAHIKDGFIIWPPQGVRTRVQMIGDSLQMIFHGEKYSGSFHDGAITWSDGDVWTRATEKDLPVMLQEIEIKSHGLMRRESESSTSEKFSS